MIIAKKLRKTIECERLEISSRKLRDFLQRTFLAKMGTIKDRNDKDLTEAEGIKKRWQEDTDKLYKKRSTPIKKPLGDSSRPQTSRGTG